MTGMFRYSFQFESSEITVPYHNWRKPVILDFSNWNPVSLTHATQMFYYAHAIVTIYCNYSWPVNNQTVFPEPNNPYRLFRLGGTAHNNEDSTDRYANPVDGYFTYSSNKYYYGLEGTKLHISKGVSQYADIYFDPRAIQGPGYQPWSDIKTTITEVVIDNELTPNYFAHMFAGFSNCITFTGLNNVNTRNVDYIHRCFEDCENAQSLNIVNWGTNQWINTTEMFSGCSNLTSIYNNYNWKTGLITGSDDMFTDCSSLVGAISYDSSKTDINYANPTTGYFTGTPPTTVPVYFNGTPLQSVYFNGTQLNHLYFNGSQVY